MAGRRQRVGGGSVEQLSRTLGLREEKKRSREEVPLSFGVLLSTGVAAAAQGPGVRVRLSRVTQAY